MSKKVPPSLLTWVIMQNRTSMELQIWQDRYLFIIMYQLPITPLEHVRVEYCMRITNRECCFIVLLAWSSDTLILYSLLLYLVHSRQPSFVSIVFVRTKVSPHGDWSFAIDEKFHPTSCCEGKTAIFDWLIFFFFFTY